MKLIGYFRSVFLLALLGAFLQISFAQSSHAASGPVVIERIGRSDSTPEWTYGARVMWQEEDNIIFAYSLEMGGESRPDICMKAASL